MKNFYRPRKIHDARKYEFLEHRRSSTSVGIPRARRSPTPEGAQTGGGGTAVVKKGHSAVPPTPAVVKKGRRPPSPLPPDGHGGSRSATLSC